MHWFYVTYRSLGYQQVLLKIFGCYLPAKHLCRSECGGNVGALQTNLKEVLNTIMSESYREE